MKKRTDPPQASDEQVRALLERYKCPVPFHEVRTRLLGNIATPSISASPMRVVEGLWGGELVLTFKASPVLVARINGETINVEEE
jgi:hypothetical protein